jgi:predicted TPR repeat methyltransferase
MGVALVAMGDLDAAVKSYQQALKIKPDYADAYSNMGNALKEKGDLDAAIDSYKKALKINPNYADAFNNMGVALVAMGDLDAAVKSYQQALKIKPDLAEAYFGMGSALQKQGDLDAAIDSYKSALKIKPDYAHALNNMGAVQKQKGDTEAAVRSFKQALNIKPDYAVVQHTLDALTGKQTESVPNDYIEALFDDYAVNFDDGLVKKLEYRFPKLIAELIIKNQSGAPLGSILDLGCGTGLAGVELKEFCHNIEGIDLSKEMLTEARRKNVYDKLNHTGIIEYLSEAMLDFDLFVSADVFVYVGELSEVFRLIKSRNKRKGRLVFSTEHTQKDGFTLETSGRFSHSRSYIESLCEEFNYQVLHFSKRTLRKEKGEFLTGGLYLLEF